MSNNLFCQKKKEKKTRIIVEKSEIILKAELKSKIQSESS